ncbi:MAG: hypothetical protein JWR24_3404, partial [Actinoallomurus sp.]|nr:hypothetical protein [Actinoallomurus sp.]
ESARVTSTPPEPATAGGQAKRSRHRDPPGFGVAPLREGNETKMESADTGER